MTVKITCGQCGKRYGAPDRLVGKTIKCPQCGATIEIPAPSAKARPRTAPTPSLESLFDEELSPSLRQEESTCENASTTPLTENRTGANRVQARISAEVQKIDNNLNALKKARGKAWQHRKGALKDSLRSSTRGLLLPSKGTSAVFWAHVTGGWSALFSGLPSVSSEELKAQAKRGEALQSTARVRASLIREQKYLKRRRRGLMILSSDFPSVGMLVGRAGGGLPAALLLLPLVVVCWIISATDPAVAFGVAVFAVFTVATIWEKLLNPVALVVEDYPSFGKKPVVIAQKPVYVLACAIVLLICCIPLYRIGSSFVQFVKDLDG